jgi:hypothetical protein
MKNEQATAWKYESQYPLKKQKRALRIACEQNRLSPR